MATLPDLSGHCATISLMKVLFLISPVLLAIGLLPACVRKPDRNVHNEMAAHRQCVSLATASLAPIIFSKRADPVFIKLVVDGKKAIEASKSFEQKEAVEKKNLDDLMKFLRKESPVFAEKCEKLVRVYKKCDQYFDHPDRFRSCVEFEQTPIVKDMNAYLLRNYHP
jgi:hypothetical protein